MTFQTNWHISGVDFDSSTKAFIQSAEHATNSSTLKGHESKFNKSFKEHINENARRSGIEADNFGDVFSLEVNGGAINFINNEPLITQRYEYGYYMGSNDTNEEYYEEYMIQTSPRYFIRPAIQETLNDIRNVMLEDAKKEYNLLKERKDGFL